MDDVYVLYQVIGDQMHLFERYGSRREAVTAAKKEFRKAHWAVVLERVVARSDGGQNG